jgi:RHS repeat-associated protein
VLVTVSDKKIGHSSNGTTIDYYEADVITANDMYPFGMIMPGRKYSSISSYRYGFNGQEKSNEINESSYTAEAWQYDARLGRRWNIDPVVKPFESPYATLANNPIWLTDPDGRDTTLPAADGRNITLPTGATFETYQAGTSYTLNGKEVNVQAGQLRAFTVDGKRYQARWNQDDLSFSGYQDDAGNSIVQTNTFQYSSSLNLSNGSYLNPINLGGLMYGWDSYTRLNSYIGPMTEAQNLFKAGQLSANSASMRRFFFLQDARSKLSPLGDFISESPLFNGKSLDKAKSQASKVLYSNMDEATKASKVFNLRASTTNWAKFGRVAGPALTVATQGYVYYTIIRDNPPLEKVQEDLDTPFNPGYWIYRRTFGKWLEGIAK